MAHRPPSHNQGHLALNVHSAKAERRIPRRRPTSRRAGLRDNLKNRSCSVLKNQSPCTFELIVLLVSDFPWNDGLLQHSRWDCLFYRRCNDHWGTEHERVPLLWLLLSVASPLPGCIPPLVTDPTTPLPWPQEWASISGQPDNRSAPGSFSFNLKLKKENLFSGHRLQGQRLWGEPSWDREAVQREAERKEHRERRGREREKVTMFLFQVIPSPAPSPYSHRLILHAINLSSSV